MTKENPRDISKDLERSIAALPQVDTLPFHSRLNPHYTKEHLLLSQTGANILFALNKARAARELAISYRDFTVGATLVGMKYRPSLLQDITGINIKPEEESAINIHAEQLALTKLEENGFESVSMVVVVGETQSDQQSGKAMHTLHPCGICRNILLASPMIDPELTLVVSALPSFKTIEIASLKDLKAFHENGDESGILRAEFATLLDLFKPVTTKEPIHLVDDDRTLAEERIWTNAIDIPLIERRRHLLAQVAMK